VPGQNRLTAFDAKTHAELWKYGDGEGRSMARLSPVPSMRWVGVPPIVAGKPHPRDPVAGRWEVTEPVWVSQKAGPSTVSALLPRAGVRRDGRWHPRGPRRKTGKEHYRERLKGAFNSSPVAGNGHVYVSNNDGITSVLKAGTEFEAVSSNNLGERISASPAITGDAMIYRTDSHLYCIGPVAPTADDSFTRLFDGKSLDGGRSS